MDVVRLIRMIVICGALLAAGFTLLYLERSQKDNPLSTDSLTASNTYLGPVGPGVDNPRLVKVEIIVRDAPDLAGVQIVNVEFDERKIPLRPRDIYGNRGEASFQVMPGKYLLNWKVNRDKFAWPRTIEHQEEVTISPRDLWLQIYIEGEIASIR